MALPKKVKSNNNNSSKSRAGLNIKLWVKWLVLVLVAAALAFFAWQYFQAKQEIDRLSDPQVAAEAETEKLVAKVGELIELPTGETPTVATVVDKERLRDQPFFANAENQDRVLIYTQARKAILYRPSTDKIIEVAPINIGESQQQDQ